MSIYLKFRRIVRVLVIQTLLRLERLLFKTYPWIEDCARCYDCGRNVHDFLVPDKLWKEIVGKEIVLCYDCFCDRADKKTNWKWMVTLSPEGFIWKALYS